MHAAIDFLPTPETLDDFADSASRSDTADQRTTRLFRDMAAEWRATQRQLNETQAENSRLAATLATAHQSAARLEALAAATANALASIRPPHALCSLANDSTAGVSP